MVKSELDLPAIAAGKIEEDEANLELIRQNIHGWFEDQIPRRIIDNGEPFTCVVVMVAREGRGLELLARMNHVHTETDEKELMVYSHRILRGYVDDADLDKFCVIIEYDDPAAFYVHYRGEAIKVFPLFPSNHHLLPKSNASFYTSRPSDRKIKSIRAAPASFFKLPESLEREGGMFVTVMTLRVKKEFEEEVLGYLNQVHEETDENELAVYAHRVLRGRSEDEKHKIYIIVDYDEPAAFRKHFQGDAVQKLIHGDWWSDAPQLSFFRDHY
ncbi:hypothetical protein BDY24DRAFT_417261 [Mrakia frigida]|uniref:uncharacterized protein n=1 Tax=Mrakia frigida TaxID=29902 RepID=UPI003FCC25C5